MKSPALKYNHTYKNLTVYKKSQLLSLEILNFLLIKKSYKYQFIRNQLLRSSFSVGANIAEGYGRYYQKTYRQFLSIARGSSFETDYWLEIMSKIEKSDKIDDFLKKNEEIGKMLTTMMKNFDSKK